MLLNEFHATVTDLHTMATLLGWTDTAAALLDCDVPEDDFPTEEMTKALARIHLTIPNGGYAAWDPYVRGRDAIDALGRAARDYAIFHNWTKPYDPAPQRLSMASGGLTKARHRAGAAALSFARYGHFSVEKAQAAYDAQAAIEAEG